MARILLMLPLVLCLIVPTGWGQSAPRTPHIGYIYPSGGQQGTVVHVIVGGQYFRGVDRAYVSGEGVHASVIKYYRPVRNIPKEQRTEIQKRIKTLRNARLAEQKRIHQQPVFFNNRTRNTTQQAKPDTKAPTPNKRPTKKNASPRTASKGQDKKTKTAGYNPVEHPLLDNLEQKSLRELNHTAYYLFFPRNKKQQNAQLGELALVEIRIDPDASLGDRELRLQCPAGLTNPLVFQVGQFPESSELEPNDPQTYQNPNALPLPVYDLPVLLNGQIMPGDIDHFRFRATKGQRLVIQTQARHFIPYLADTVPGWFQAAIALYDANGKEVAYADDFRFDPDPVLYYEIQKPGVYTLEIRDALYRGREDFVYRVALGEFPFITQAFPLGGMKGVKTTVSLDGWNLSGNTFSLDTKTENDFRQAVLRTGSICSNPFAYTVGTLPESYEIEPNNSIPTAQWIGLPRIINGRMAKAGDVDVYRFRGQAGAKIVAEVNARRLRSPLDSLLRLMDASGHILEWNDDHDNPASGLETHHADSYLMAELPVTGVYSIQLSDAQNHGGNAYAYRLRISHPRPDFALRLHPSSITVRAGLTVPVWVQALRKDGFEGEIELVLKDAPTGFILSGNRIPSGRDKIRMTITAPLTPLDQPVALSIEGHAHLGGQTLVRPVIPCEDRMQAFLYRHLVPSQQFLVAVTGSRRNAPPIEVAGGTVQIPQGGDAHVQIHTPKYIKTQGIELQLNDPPEGISLKNISMVPQGLTFALSADKTKAQAGLIDNLIVEAFTQRAIRRKNGKDTGRKRRVLLGVLPAIPFEIVAPSPTP